MASGENERPIIKKVIKVQAGGHHGGAWKVAYADFVTAMMAFFMLLWLLNVAPPETLAGLADYFTPTTAAVSGRTGARAINPPSGREGLNPSPVVVITRPGPPPTGASEDNERGGEIDRKTERDRIEELARKREDDAFAKIERALKTAIQESPELSRNQDQILFEITEEGLKIQLMDKDRRAMFKSGSDELYSYASRLLCNIGEAVQILPNRVTVEGHTNSGAFEGQNATRNWGLSADRANTARRVLGNCGVSNDRVSEIIGKAASDPLYPDSPGRVENRRITILLVREPPVVPPEL